MRTILDKLKFFTILTLIISAVAAPRAYALDFTAGWVSSETDQTQAVDWGDYDSDGDLDQLVGNKSGANRVYSNNAGNFTLQWSSSETGDTISVDWGDYDGDGDLDQLAGDQTGLRIIYENTGSSNFSISWQAAVSGGGYSLSWGDYDGDGDLDFLAGEETYNMVYRNDGNDSFSVAWTATDSVKTYSAAWADLDSDGDLDFISGNDSENKIFRNDGDNTFTPVWLWFVSGVSSETSLDIAVADFDSDGDLDFISANTVFSAGDQNRLYQNDGINSFTNVWSAIDEDSTYCAAWGDADGDGDYDHAVGSTGGFIDPFRVYTYTSGTDFDRTWTSPITPSVMDIAWGDSDGDGDLDLLLGVFGATNSVYINGSAIGNSAPAAPSITAEPDGSVGTVTLEWTAPADDITAAGLLTYQVRVGSCSGCDDVSSGEFTPPYGNAGATTSYSVNIYTAGTYYWSAAAIDNTGFLISSWAAEDDFVLSPSFTLSWTSTESNITSETDAGDVDNDGDLDFITTKVGAVNDLYYNTGSGFTASWSSTESEASTGVDFGDYDGDGDLDILVSNTAVANRLYANTGGTSFSSVWTSSESDSSQDAVWFDCDNDGDLDQLIANGSSESNRVYTNSGSGNFSATWSSTETDTTVRVEATDYDGDGLSDMLVANIGPGVNRVYRNAGGCTFNLVWSSTESENSYGVAWADYDGDGDEDVIVANNTVADRVYSNEGVSSFSLAWSSTETNNTNDIVAGDVDGDGDNDLLALTASANALYGKITGNNFSSIWTSTETDTTQTGAWADLDGDGDLDFIAGNTTSDRVYTNDINPSNIAPTVPVASAVSDATFDESAPEKITLSWSDASDDNTPAAQITYHVRVGTCSGCNNVMSGSFTPPAGNAGATNSFTIALSNPATYYWSVAAVDSTGYATSAWTTEDSFLLQSTKPLWSYWTSSTDKDTYGSAWGDYDGDGDLDQLTGNTDGATVYQNTGTGFSSVWTAAEGYSSKAVGWGDYDNDGDLDHFAGSRVYRKNGGNSFTLIWSPASVYDSEGAAWGDYDRDGDLDLLVGHLQSFQASVIFGNNGDDTFTQVWAEINAASTYGVAWGDYDNDGDLDFAEANYGQPNKLYENEGDGLFTIESASSELDNTKNIVWVDYDNDEDLDYVAANYNNSVRIYSNSGGSFSVAWSSTESESTADVAVGDYDGDGDLDIACGNEISTQNDRLYRNDGGSFTSVWTSGYAAMSRSVAWGDIDADGDIDLLAGSRSYPGSLYENRVYENNESVSNTAPPAPTLTDELDQYYGYLELKWTAPVDDITPSGLVSYQVKVGTTSGGRELVTDAFYPPFGNTLATTTYYIDIWTPGTYYWSVQAVDATGYSLSSWSAEDSFILYTPPFETVWKSDETNFYTTSVAWGDYDNDGDLDHIAGNDGQQNQLYRNDSSDTFTLVWSSSDSDGTMKVAWGDYDGDGDLDILVGNYQNANRVYKNNGGSMFSIAWLSSQSDKTAGIEWGDADGDGDLDIAAGNSSEPNRVYINSGNSSFTLGWSSTESYPTGVVLWQDYDQDGDKDLLSGDGANNVNLYKNDGTGSFALAWTSPGGDGNSMVAGAWGDYDHDGDMDFVAGNAYNNSNVYQNDGGDNFSIMWTSPSASFTWSISTGDYDGDGWSDILIGNMIDKNRVYYNKMDGTFGLYWSSRDSDVSRSVVWGDYDGDGDLDQLAGNYDQANHINRNNLNPTNTAPSAPSITSIADGNTGDIQYQWTAPADDNTPSAQLNYQLRVGTCSGCSDVMSGAFVPPMGSAGATTSYFLDMQLAGTYYWSVAAVDETGFSVGPWSSEDSFVLQIAVFSKTWTSTETSASQWGAWADYDDDGDLDFAVADSSAANRVYRYAGGGFTSAWSTTETDTSNIIRWADYNNDGYLDMLTGNNGVNRVYANDGSAGFTLAWSSTEADNTAGADWCDIDRDGDLDFVASADTNGVRYYQNSGSSTFQAAWTGADAGSTVFVDCGDVNRDGMPDILAGTGAGYGVRIYRNLANSAFINSWTSTETDVTGSASLFDYDADGDLDILVVNDASQNRVYTNSGGASFSLVWSSLLSDNSISSAQGDYDGDGDIDFVIANQQVALENNRLYRNDGGGSFVMAWDFPDSDNTSSFAMADYDGDGDMDLLETNSGAVADYVFENVIDATNSGPSAPAAAAVSDLKIVAATAPVTFAWSASTDDNSSSALLSYQLKIGTCSGCNDVLSGEFSPSFTNIGATTSTRISFAATGTYYWSVRAEDTTSFATGAWSTEDSFTLSDPPSMFVSAWSGATTAGVDDAEWGDLDNDGDFDFVLANELADEVYRNDGSDSFVSAWTSSGTSQAGAVKLADMDGDGDLDILIANNSAAMNRMYSNDGSMSFSSYWISVEADSSTGIDIADVDRDGDLDFVVSNTSATPDRVYENTNGSFAVSWSSTETDNSLDVEFADLDEDGYMDLLVANDTLNRVYQNGGDGTFSLLWTASKSGNTMKVAAGDYDSDGDADILFANYSSSTSSYPSRIYQNLGTSSFVLVWESLEQESTYAAAWGDLDGDGDLDIMMGAGNSMTPTTTWNMVYRNAGSGDFYLEWMTSESEYSYSIDFADYDSDGDLDALCGTFSLTEPTRVYENVQSISNTSPTAPAMNAVSDVLLTGNDVTVALSWSSAFDDNTPSNLLTYHLRLGTCSGCGDIVSGMFSPGLGDLGATLSTFIVLGDPGTYYWSMATIDSTGFSTSTWGIEDSFMITESDAVPYASIWTSVETDSTTSGAWGDYDGDGDLDFVIGNDNSDDNAVYSNKGNGNFDVMWYSFDASLTTGVAWGDCDNDGDLDLVVSNDGEANAVFTNDGGDSFTRAWSSITTDSSMSADWGDYDSDGDLDFIVANDGTVNRIYKNDGAGSFSVGWYPAETDDASTSALWADVDADGDLDFLVGNKEQVNRYYRNDGGIFTLQWSSVETDYTVAIVIGDYDSDGDPDFASANGMSEPDRIYRNVGSETFSSMWVSDETLTTTGGAWGDYDGDGDKDLILSSDGNAMRIYSPGLSGMFDIEWQSSETDNFSMVQFGDYDADGDLDFLTGNTSGSNRVYKNNATISNTAPAAPSLTTQSNQTLDGSSKLVTLSWSAPFDDISTSDLISYQVKLGTCTGCNDIISGAFAPPVGNARSNTSMKIVLTSTATYYWSVAAIDGTGFSMSQWSFEDSFSLVDPTSSYELGVGWSLVAFPGITASERLDTAIFDTMGLNTIVEALGFQNGAPVDGDESGVNIGVGYGYWLYATGTTTLVVGGEVTGSSDTITIDSLSEGWNLMGNPFNVYMSWGDNIKVNCGNGDKALSVAKTMKYLEGNSYYYSGTDYVKVEPGETLPPWKGFFVRTYESGCTIKLQL